MKKDLIVKDNALINASYSLDLVEQRLVLLAIIEARETGKGINEPLTIHAESYVNQFGVHRNTAYKVLKSACNDLFARQFSYQSLSEKGNIQNHRSRWVSEIIYAENEAIVKLIFAPAIVPLITRLQEHFTSYEIEQVSKLNTGYAVRLYELLICWRSTGKTPIIDIEEFRNRVGINIGEYKLIADLKKRIIDSSIKQINQHTDIIATYEQHKTGRTITGFSFKFKQKPQADKPKVLTDKQLDMFADKLAQSPKFQNHYRADVGASIEEYAQVINKKLKQPQQVQEWLPHLKEVGYQVK